MTTLDRIHGNIPVRVKTFWQTTGFKTLLWALAGAVLDALIALVPAMALPDWARPMLPVAMGLLGALRAHVKTKSVPAAALQDAQMNVTPVRVALDSGLVEVAK